MKWNAIFAGIALIAVIICLDTCQQSKEQSNLKEAAQASNERLLKRLAHEDSEKALRDTFIVHQTKKLYNDSVRHGKVQKSLLSEIKRLTDYRRFRDIYPPQGLNVIFSKDFIQVTRQIRPDSVISNTPFRLFRSYNETIFYIDSIGNVRGRVFANRDSIIHFQDSLITDLTNERDSLRLGFNPIIDSLKANIESEHQKFLYTLHDRDSLLKRLEKPNNWGLGLSAGPGLMTTGGEVRAGIGMQVGLVYRLQLRNPFKRKR